MLEEHKQMLTQEQLHLKEVEKKQLEEANQKHKSKVKSLASKLGGGAS